MKRLIAVVLLGLMVVGVGLGAVSEPLKIGITKIVEHPALDAVQQGVIDALTAAGYEEGVDVDPGLPDVNPPEGSTLVRVGLDAHGAERVWKRVGLGETLPTVRLGHLLGVDLFELGQACLLVAGYIGDVHK